MLRGIKALRGIAFLVGVSSLSGRPGLVTGTVGCCEVSLVHALPFTLASLFCPGWNCLRPSLETGEMLVPSSQTPLPLKLRAKTLLFVYEVPNLKYFATAKENRLRHGLSSIAPGVPASANNCCLSKPFRLEAL